MYQVIARKYRPQSFDDVLNQEHIKTTLRNAIAQNRIAHGYIFSGQRGTGKTTTARIVARCLNCIHGPTDHPCGVCASCLEIAAGGSVDVIEIDAASNRGINEMRELRENVRYQPARDRYKIFIVDEAHQITSEAFNALLKTIEEPPEWAVFILCTTESHKIPATIASRCQHFSFRSVDFNDLIARMREICASEGIEADDETLAVIAQSGEGSVRDSLSALDQAIACCGNRLETAQVRSLLGAFSIDAMVQVTDALAAQDGAKILALVDELERNGGSVQHFAREVSRYLRNVLVTKIAGGDSRLVNASPAERAEMARIAVSFTEEDLTRYLQLSLDLFRDLQFSLTPRFHLEIGLIKMIQAGKLVAIEEALASLGSSPRSAATASPVPQRPPVVASPAPPRTGPSPFELDRTRVNAVQEKKTGLPNEPISRPAPILQNKANPAGSALPNEPTAAATANISSNIAAPPPDPDTDWRARLHEAMVAANMPFSADAILQSDVVRSNNEILITAPKSFQLDLGQTEIDAAIRQLGIPGLRGRVIFGEVKSAPAAVPMPGDKKPAEKKNDDEVTTRALAHPEVQRYRELFGGEVRTVRNLKEHWNE